MPILWTQRLFITRVLKAIKEAELINAISWKWMCSPLSAVLHYGKRQQYEESSPSHSLYHELDRKELCFCETEELQNAKLVFN